VPVTACHWPFQITCGSTDGDRNPFDELLWRTENTSPPDGPVASAYEEFVQPESPPFATT
jgi:hypothetical protein